MTQTTNTTTVTTATPTLAKVLTEMRLASIKALAEQEDSQVEDLYAKIRDILEKEAGKPAHDRKKIRFSIRCFRNGDVVVRRDWLLKTFIDVKVEVMAKLVKKFIEDEFEEIKTSGNSELLYAVSLDV